MSEALPRPGRLILVVGPSGSGKDTLIAGAKEEFRDDPSVRFPNRVVTRPASSFEHHDSLSEAEFEYARNGNAFAFWWEAHGLKYGIPCSVEDDLRAGKTVVCNVSRAIIAPLRERYANIEVVLVTAPDDVLAARLAARRRETDGPVQERMKRSEKFLEFRADHTLSNTSGIDEGVGALCRIIRGEA